MRIKQYGITLRRVEKRDIELIRRSRNSEAIKQKMIYREHITKEMQLKWFKSIEKNPNQIYYIIIQNRKKVGLINAKNYNLKNKLTESGLFLFSQEYYNTHIPVIASLIMISTAFYALNENVSYIRVLKTNKKALNYNKSLGYFIDKEKENYYIMKLTKNSFEQKTSKLRKAIKNIYGKNKLEFITEPIDYEIGIGDKFTKEINNIPSKIILKKLKKENYLKIILNL